MKWNLRLVFFLGAALQALAQPVLRYEVKDEQLELSWPSTPHFLVQTRTNLHLGEWTYLGTPPNQVGTNVFLRVNMQDEERYFRLIRTIAGVYVDATNGNDRATGDFGDPVASIGRALQLVEFSPLTKSVFVAKGTYELNNEPLKILPGITLAGGFDSSQGWIRNAGSETIIQGANPIIIASNVTETSTVEGFKIEASEGKTAGESSYGIVSIESKLVVRNNVITAGPGQNGTTGANGTNQPAAMAGGFGGAGSCSSSSAPGQGGSGGASPCGRNGGTGGRGGAGGLAGQMGQNGVGNSPGGNFGPAGDPGIAGGNGMSGTHGSLGLNGEAQFSMGLLTNGLFFGAAGNSGLPGTPGNGGGGGGGGGGQDCLFCQEGSGNGGGGGGAGGCGGVPGAGGGGGGGSFGMLVIGGEVSASGNNFITANGGDGGRGGNGGLGGRGGDPGQGAAACLTEVGRGGNGGRGGDGGGGGAGTGGVGGPSVGILSTVPLQLSSNLFTIGNGGNGGLGGGTNNPAPSGATGTTHQVFITSGLVINEVDYDQASTDAQEFVEIYNASLTAWNLADVYLVFINGSDNNEYRRIDLASAGILSPGQYLVVGSDALLATVPEGPLKVSFGAATDYIQNGSPDGIALITKSGQVLDALSYEGAITTANIVGFNSPVNLVEGTQLNGAVADGNTAGSLIRSDLSIDTNDANSDWSLSSQPTPGMRNIVIH